MQLVKCSKDWQVRRKSRTQKTVQEVTIFMHLMTETDDAQVRNSVTKSANITALRNNIWNPPI